MRAPSIAAAYCLFLRACTVKFCCRHCSSGVNRRRKSIDSQTTKGEVSLAEVVGRPLIARIEGAGT